jgi:hypothetical protein
VWAEGFNVPLPPFILIDNYLNHDTCAPSSPPFSRREKGFTSLSLRERDLG